VILIQFVRSHPGAGSNPAPNVSKNDELSTIPVLLDPQLDVMIVVS
jgi:hypothetical protein